jgi:hypothetical protein
MNNYTESNQIAKDYILRFRKELRFMDSEVRDNIIQEIESHLYDKAESLGELNDDTFYRAAMDFGPPKELAKHYKELYGYSKWFILVLMLFGFVIALFTVPMSIPSLNSDLIAFNTICIGITTLITILVFIYIIYISMEFGKWPGMFVGFACMFGRIIMLAVLVGILESQSGNLSVTADGGPCLGFGLVSIFMPIVGYIAGRTTFKFKKGFALED